MNIDPGWLVGAALKEHPIVHQDKPCTTNLHSIDKCKGMPSEDPLFIHRTSFVPFPYSTAIVVGQQLFDLCLSVVVLHRGFEIFNHIQRGAGEDGITKPRTGTVFV